MPRHPRRAQPPAMDDGRPDIGNAALALAAAAFDAARLPLRVAGRLPGVSLLARDGAFVRARLRSRVDGIAARAIDGVLRGPLPDAAVQAAIDHGVLQRIAAGLRDGRELEDGAPEPAPPRPLSRPSGR